MESTKKIIKISKLCFPSTFLTQTDYGFKISFANNIIPLSTDEAILLANEIKRLVK